MTQDKQKDRALKGTVEAKSARESVYVVQPGDNLSRIAKKIYGEARRWPEIFEANKDKISDPSKISPGQKLRIPYGPGDIAPPEAPTEPLPAETPAEGTTPRKSMYVVQPGDSLSKIAKKVYGNGRRWPEIFEANKDKISDPSRVRPGQELRILYRPDDAVPPPEAPAQPLPVEKPAEPPVGKVPPPEAPPPPIQPKPIEPPPQPPPVPPTEPPQPPVAPAPSSEPVWDGSGEIAGESYGDFPVSGGPANPPAEQHPDLNLAMLGYELTNARKGLVDYGGGTDPNAPQLPSLFADNRTPTISAVYQIHGWDWESRRRAALITNPEVTVVGLAVTPGETIHVPRSGYTIGEGYAVVVLYASDERITLKYTPDDHVVYGYTIHVENVTVEPRLLALYQSCNEAGRRRLPALRAGQAFGRARGNEIGVAIRDTGSPMDPRSRKDWWQGR